MTFRPRLRARGSDSVMSTHRLSEAVAMDNFQHIPPTPPLFDGQIDPVE